MVVVFGFAEFVGELGACCVADSASVFGGGETGGDEEVGFPGAGVSKEWTEDQTSFWGYVPNYVAAFASRPDVAKAWTTLNLTVRNGMDRRRFEIATIAAARAMRNTYCTVAHSKFLRDTCDDEPTMIAMSGDPDSTALDATDHAIIAFAGKVARDAADISTEDIASLRSVGLTDNEIADVVFTVAARSFFTRVLDGMGIHADHELSQSFEPALIGQMTVGRSIDSPGDNVRSGR